MIEIAFHRRFSNVVANPRVATEEQGMTNVSVRSMHVSQVLT
jgi:hypothetical protein